MRFNVTPIIGFPFVHAQPAVGFPDRAFARDPLRLKRVRHGRCDGSKHAPLRTPGPVSFTRRVRVRSHSRTT